MNTGHTGPFTPVLVLDIELTEPLPAIKYDGEHHRARMLVRLGTEPVASCLIPVTGDIAPPVLGQLLWAELGETVAARYAAAGLPRPRALPPGGLGSLPADWPFLRRRAAVLADAPFISVVLCTRDRPGPLANCLEHVARMQYPRFEVVVVDNAPAADTVRDVVAAAGDRLSVQYVPEPRPGVSWARNSGIAAASGDIIAFLDDDEEPDRHWLTGLVSGFARGDDVGCVTGLTVPARLDTEAEELFEQLGGHSDGLGFAPAIFSRSGPRNPLYPRPPFGAGANMAFRRQALTRIGGFDVALGAGTPAQASEDTLAFTLVLLDGQRIVYEPAALTRHYHRQDWESLARQARGYGVGVTAYYIALLRHRPSVLPGLVRLIPAAANYLRNRAPAQPGSGDLPARLQGERRRGMLAGPVAYARSWRRQSKAGGGPAAGAGSRPRPPR